MAIDMSSYLKEKSNKNTVSGQNVALPNNETKREKSFFDIVSSPVATIADLGEEITTGAGKAVEGIADWGIGLLGTAANVFGAYKLEDALTRAAKYDVAGNTIAKIDDWAEDNSWLQGNKIGETIRQVGYGVGGMLPSIAVGAFTGGAGTVASMGTFMAGAAGQSTEQALNEGARIDQATAYGTLSGLTEGAIEYASGKLGGTNILAKGAAGKIFSGGAGKLAKTFAEEGLEEVASDIIDPLWKGITYSGKYDAPEISNLFQSFAVGGLTALAMGGGAKAANMAKYGVQGEKALSTYNEILELNEEEFNLEKKGKLTNELSQYYANKRTELVKQFKDQIATLDKDSKKYAKLDSSLNIEDATTAAEKFDVKKKAIYETVDLMNKKYKTDIKVQFVGKNQMSQFEDATSTVDGYIKDNTIYINEESADPYSVVVAHEITHSTENNQLYNELANDILSTMSQEELSKARNDLKSVYKDATNEVLDKEIVANYVSKMLGSDSKTLLNTFTRKPNIVTKIFEWIESKLAKMSKNSAEYEQYANLRNKIRNVMSSEKVSESQNGTSFSKQSAVVDSEGNGLSMEQQQYFKDSKVRDENGNLLVTYHGSDNNFTKFEHKFMGKSGTSYGYGFYFTNNTEVAKGYGNTNPYYLNITKPLSLETREINKSELKQLLKAIDSDGNGMLSDFEDVSYYGYDRVLEKAANQLIEYNDNDVDIISEIINLNGGGSSSEQVYQILRDTLGYDGIITDYHTGDKLFVVFNSNQIKDTSNKTPTENDDIRFARKSRKPPEGQTELELDFETEPSQSEAKVEEKSETAKKETKTVEPTTRKINKIAEEYNKPITKEETQKVMEETSKKVEVIIPGEGKKTTQVVADRFKNFMDAVKSGHLFTYLKIQLVDSSAGVTDKIRRKYKDNKQLANEKVKKLKIEINKTQRSTARADWDIKEIVEPVWQPIEAKGEQYTRDFQNYELHKLNISRMRYSDNALKEIAKLDKTLEKQLADLANKYNNGEYKTKRDYELDVSKAKSKHETKLDVWKKEYEQAKDAPVFGKDVTAKQSEEVVKMYLEMHPEFAEYHEKVADVFEMLRKKQLAAGLITDIQFELMEKAAGRDYVPTHRVGKDGTSTAALSGNIGVKNGLHRAKGSTEDIRSIMVQMCEQIISVEKKSAINELFNYVKNELPEEFTDDKIVSKERIDAEDVDSNIIPKENEVFFYENGERVVYRLDDDVAALFQSMRNIPSRYELSIFGRISSGLVKLTRNVTTQYNPFFAARNLFRDYFDAVIYTKNKGTFNKNYVECAKDVFSQGKWYKMYMENGGASASFYNQEQGRDVSKKGILSKISAFNESIELIPRVTEMKSTYERLIAEGVSHEQAIQEAMFDAAEVTVNFGNGGIATKWLSRNLIPYLGGAVQGSAKFVRTFIHPESFNEWVAAVAKAGMMAIPAIILNEALYGDDDDYEELSEDVKSGYYLFKVADNKFIRIPRGRIESIFGDFAQRTIRYAKGNKDAFDTYGETIKTAVSPVESFTRTVFSPFTDVKTNVAWHGGMIESSSLQNKPIQERYDENTSEIAKVLSKAFPKLSPKKWHYLLDQYSGVIGDIVLPLTSKSASVETVLLKSSGYYVNSLKNNKYTNQFYNLGDELTQAKNSANATGVDKAKLRYYNKMSGKINELYKAKDGLSGDEADATQLLIVQMQRQTIDNLKVFTETLEKYNYGLSDEDLYDEYYREATRECFGAETALMDYDDSVYEKATIFNNCGIDWNTFYNIYFDAKDIKSDYDDNGKAISGSKKQKVTKYVKSLNLTATQKYMVMGLLGYKNANGKEQVHSLLRSKGYSGEKLNEIMKLCGYGD